MNTDQIIALQQAIGTTPDGFWGPKSIAACQSHLRKLMPSPSPWPASDQASLRAFYGKPGDESQLVMMRVPFPVIVCYEGNPVSSIRCHKKVADSLSRVIAELGQKFPQILRKYDGCFNNRPMRGGSIPSMHAYGAAIDFDAGDNGNHTHWPTVATMPLVVMEAFAREGWLPAGAFWSRDAMHFQATQ